MSGAKRVLINKAYSDAIENSGGLLLMLASGAGEEDLDALLQHVDGVLIPGGADVNPALYGEVKKEYSQTPDDDRDALELALIGKAMEKRLPILAICRGFQILNIKFGGSLYQDIEKEMKNSIKHDYHNDGPRSLLAHRMSLTKDSLISKIIGELDLKVNSLHHQGIKDLGKGLVAVGVAPDGLIEAIESPGYPYLIGMQWHPEELTDDPVWKRFFDDFIEVCSK